MDNTKLLVIQVLIDVVDDIMHNESFNPITGVFEDKGDTQIERERWHKVFHHIVEAHNAMNGQPYLCVTSNYKEDYNFLKNSVRQMVDDFYKKDDCCQNCIVRQYPACGKGIPCCQCKKSSCNGRQPCPKKGGEA